MSDTTDLAAWLTEIWDEREAAARAEVEMAEEYFPVSKGYTCTYRWSRQIWVDGLASSLSTMPGAPSPTEVLARIAADREILADYEASVTEHREHWERQLARPASELHADRAHPDYEYATTEGQRKAWDDVDVPPISRETWEPEPGWERNVDEGRKGWDRFDYTEESYWRRLLPEGKRRGPFVPPLPRHIKLLASAYADRPGYREEWRP